MHLGYFAVLVALFFAVCGAYIGFFVAKEITPRQYRTLIRLAMGFCMSMWVANLAMIGALVTHDFSVKYVAQVGSRSTPLLFTIVSLWSALEGSILFWGAILGTYAFVFLWQQRHRVSMFNAYTVAVLMLVASFFALLIAGPANPFLPVFPVPLDGPGPNPLLQNHILMVIHPPMLYLGYVGMSIPFAMAVAALIVAPYINQTNTLQTPAHMDAALFFKHVVMTPLRQFIMVAWLFLSIGIILGAWWAYAVLGWGGYWAWDPVENASFLPWLVTTALFHSMIVHERKGMLKIWTLSLTLLSFLLTLLGTFMTRSGVFNSVHAFTQSEIGPAFLIFIAIILVFSVILLSTRAYAITQEEPKLPALISKETAFFSNNLLFIYLTFTILLGTTYPLIAEALSGVRVSVGEPYFNQMTLPAFVAVLYLMGLAPVLPFGHKPLKKPLLRLLVPFLIASMGCGIAVALSIRQFWVLMVLFLGLVAAIISLQEIALPLRHSTHLLSTLLQHRRRIGGHIVHLGIVIIFIAVAFSKNFVAHKQIKLAQGQTQVFNQYQFTLSQIKQGQEPHRQFLAAHVQVDNQNQHFELAPRMNFYPRSTDPVGTPAIYSTTTHDIYLSLLTTSLEEKTATMNVWIFPLVRYLWWSIWFFVIGTLLSLIPERFVNALVQTPHTKDIETEDTQG